MSGPAWAPKEISRFLDLQVTDGMTAQRIAARVGRSKPAVQSMRRKIKRLRGLGADPEELEELLVVSESIILRQGLAVIRKRAGLPLVQVRHYLRRGRVTGRPHLVDEHVRRPVEKRR
jgi:hypothetical protein